MATLDDVTTVPELRDYLGLSTTSDDQRIGGHREAAVEFIEDHTARNILDRTVEAEAIGGEWDDLVFHVADCKTPVTQTVAYRREEDGPGFAKTASFSVPVDRIRILPSSVTIRPDADGWPSKDTGTFYGGDFECGMHADDVPACIREATQMLVRDGRDPDGVDGRRHPLPLHQDPRSLAGGLRIGGDGTMTFATGRPRSGRNRQGRVRATFDRYVVMRRSDRTLDEQMGATLIEALEAVALKASRSAPTAPAGAPPASAAAPVLDADGWKGWWSAEDGIESPPRPAVPVVATSPDAPLVWRSVGEVGGDAWGTPEVFEMRVPADVRERGGSEGDQTGVDVARTVATFRVRAANIGQITGDLGSIPVGWDLISGTEFWDIIEAVSSWATDRYVDLRAVRRESATGDD